MNQLDIAKLAAQLTTSAVVAKLVGNTITQNRPQTNDIVVNVAGSLTGAVVSNKLRPTTDAMVESAAARIRAFRSNH